MKKFLIVFVVIVLCPKLSFSQNSQIVDSLEQVLAAHKKEDSVMVDILTVLHEKLMFSEPIKAKEYAEKEIKISRKVGYLMGEAKGLMHLGDFHMNRNSNDSALSYYNNAKTVFAKSKNIKSFRGEIFVNYSIADIERVSGNYENAIKTLQENLSLIEENESNPVAKAKFSAAQYNTLATVNMDKGDYKIAVIEALKALDLFTQIKDGVRKADVLKLLGDLEYASENYDKSIEHYGKSIEIYDDFDDMFYMSYAKSDMGLSFKEIGEYDKAKEYQSEAIELARNNQAKIPLAESLNN